MSFLLDTNTVSELTTPNPNVAVARWIASLDEDQVFLSVATFAEVSRGVELLPSGIRRTSLTEWFRDELPTRFNGRILDIDQRVAEAWGVILVRGQRLGETVSVMDGFFAATAEVHGLILATRNVRHFARLGIDVIDPWKTTS